MYDTLRNLIITITSVLVGYFAPLKDVVFVIFFVFLLNCLFGLVAGVGVQGEKFSLKKFFRCIMETLVFYVIVLSIYLVGEKMGNPDGAIQCISGVVYAIIYFYFVNILRNAHKLLPKSKGIKFLFYVLSFEMIKKIPYLQHYQEHAETVEKELKKEDDPEETQAMKKRAEIRANEGLLEDSCASESCAYLGKNICTIKNGQYCPMYSKKRED